MPASGPAPSCIRTRTHSRESMGKMMDNTTPIFRHIKIAAIFLSSLSPPLCPLLTSSIIIVSVFPSPQSSSSTVRPVRGLDNKIFTWSHVPAFNGRVLTGSGKSASESGGADRRPEGMESSLRGTGFSLTQSVVHGPITIPMQQNIDIAALDKC